MSRVPKSLLSFNPETQTVEGKFNISVKVLAGLFFDLSNSVFRAPSPYYFWQQLTLLIVPLKA